MGNNVPVVTPPCCCNSSAEELSAAAMDMVTQQGLSQGSFFKEVQIHNPDNGKVEEAVELRSPSWAEARCNGVVEVCSPGENNPLRRALLSAVRLDDAPAVLQFVADGADVGVLSEAMRLAAHRGCCSVVRELVAVGLSVNDSCPSTGFTPVHLASIGGHMIVCELLLDALADVQRPVGGSTALMLARKMGNVEIQEAIERHVSAMMLSDQGENDEAAHYRRAHVLPRVSPVLSEAVITAMRPLARLEPLASPAEVQVRHVMQVSAVGGPGGGDVSPPPPTPSPASSCAATVDPSQVLPL